MYQKCKLGSDSLIMTSMVKELYVWGPAFGLPSIDAQCLAAIAYLSHSNEDYILLASNDPAEGPISS